MKPAATLLATFAVLLALPRPATAGHIIWVAQMESEAGAEFIPLLIQAGHTVTEKYVTSNTLVYPDDIDEMNAADLVIVSRRASSGQYNTQDWNDLTVPLLAMSPYLLRPGFWEWFDTEELVDGTPETVIAEVPEHPLFNGITLTNGTTPAWHIAVDRQTSFSNGGFPLLGGTVLARSEEGWVLAAEWPANTVAAGPRLYVAMGSREQSDIALAGKYNITETGARILLNAVAMFATPAAVDSDGDGIVDSLDAFPNDPAEWLDTDGDGIGNNADPDDDNDGVPDEEDAFPTDPTEWQDLDGDGIGDNADPDDDNDWVPDEEDAFPKDPAEWSDTDGDGIGDNADPDADGDGVPDPPRSRIVWVSQYENSNGQEFIDLLTAKGYQVQRFVGTSATLAETTSIVAKVMNEAGLVIVSRQVASGDFNTDVWDRITAPLLSMTPYVVQSTRWGWMDSTTLPGLQAPGIFAEVPDHPLFEGVPLAGGWSEPWHIELERGTSFIEGAVENGGTLLATTDAGSVAAAYWPAGTVAAGPRLFFAAGTWESDGSSIEDAAGLFNLTPPGETAFLNAVGIFVPPPGTSPGPGPAPDFRITSVVRDSATGAVTVTWTSEAGVTYELHRSVDLQTWSPAGNPVAATGSSTSAVDASPPAGATVFYRVVDPE